MKPVNSADESILGFIDVGSNSIRLMIVRLQPQHTYDILREEKEVVRLGKTAPSNGNLLLSSMDHAVTVCRKFRELAEAFGATDVHAVATSATREAGNQKEFLSRLRAEAGVDVRVISGREEARLIYLGVTSGSSLDNDPALFVDIGGGSTEVIIGNQRHYQYIDSLGLGAIRLTAKFFADGAAGPVDDEKYQQLKRYIGNKTLRLARTIKKGGIHQAFGSSGTLINLAEITHKRLTGRGFSRGEIMAIKLKDLRQTLKILRRLPVNERRTIPGINPERADILIAGGAIIETIMERGKLKRLQVSNRALRHGMLMDYLQRSGRFPQLEELTTRELSVLRLGRSCQVDEGHAETIVSLTLQLFDSAGAVDLHAFGPPERELLGYAAFLHDIGNFLTFRDHHLHSHYLISHAELLGFTQNEITIIANLARYHRKKMPKQKSKNLKLCTPAEREIIIQLSLFLRLAEKLDRGHNGHIKQVAFTGCNKKYATLQLHPIGRCELEIWGVESTNESFLQVCGKALRLEIMPEPFTEQAAGL